MTPRRPLADFDGDLQEIPVGDSIAADLLPPVVDGTALAFFLGG